jgi:predicted anti-sigma-YlaC factor YlaD
MNGHVTEWLGAYVDGELSGIRLRRVESHLRQCSACQREVESLRALSALLKESWAAERRTSPERFVAQVGLRLPRRQQRPPAQRALEVGWKLVPAGLLFSLAFVHSVFVVVRAIQSALWMGLGREVSALLLPESSGGLPVPELSALSQASVGEAIGTVSTLVQSGSALAWLPVLYLCVMLLIGVLYCSWLASWWAQRKHRQLTAPNHTT